MLAMHNGAFQTNYVSETGNHHGKTTLPNAAKIQNWFLLSWVEVAAPDAAGAIGSKRTVVPRRVHKCHMAAADVDFPNLCGRHRFVDKD